ERDVKVARSRDPFVFLRTECDHSDDIALGRYLGCVVAMRSKRSMARVNMMVYPGTWWELMAECARVAPGKEVHELDHNDTNEISQALRWPLRLYKEAIEAARDRGEADPEDRKSTRLN